VQQPAFNGYVAEEIAPGPDIATDSDLEASIRANGISNLHPVGTCRMGADEAAVLDPRLRVRGIGHLRVVDAPVIMIGEKASDLILEDLRTRC
jgi:choline dehydrogenase